MMDSNGTSLEIDTIIIEFVFIFLYIYFFSYSITLQRVKRNCTTGNAKYPCRSRINNSINKVTTRKRSVVAQSTTEILIDEEWGVRIGIFRIFSWKFLTIGALDGFNSNWYTTSNILC